MKKIVTVHDEKCPCKQFVLDRIESQGYHRVALRIQRSEEQNESRKKKEDRYR